MHFALRRKWATGRQDSNNHHRQTSSYWKIAGQPNDGQTNEKLYGPALRICYFKGGRLSNADFGGGTITERVTELERGKILKMDVIEYNLIGRKWMGFKEAIYYFEPVGSNRCKLTRITTYTSVLTPRFYWEPMEKLGIRQEHEYVFNNLEKDLGKERYKLVRPVLLNFL